MTQAADFFVSYTSADRAWAEWIAWQLETEGYQVVVQAWDFTAGRDWAHEMQHATSTAERVVAVLSTSYLQSGHGEAEWRVFYAKDPSGELGLLLPVRVREVDPPGLLKTKVYVDLVGRDAVSARDTLLAAARGARGKPAAEPEFPGDRGRSEPSGTDAPLYPGDLPPVDSAPVGESPVTLRADDVGALRTFAAEISASLQRRGFSETDIEAFRISLRELVDNVAIHVGGDETVQLRLSNVDRLSYTYQEALGLEIADGGEGFDFDDALMRSEVELVERGVEHGLLRAYRLGSWLAQFSTEPHVMGWMRERIPQAVPSVFGDENVIPFVFSYRQEAIRIWRNIHTFFQFENYLRRSQAFMNLIFDPLQRPTQKYVGIEIIGQGWTGVLALSDVLDRLLSFTRENDRFDKQLVLFADTGPSEQRRLREYCQSTGIVMFEDESAIRDLRVADLSRISKQTKSHKSRRK